jgi:hypothetical protein
LPDGLLESLLGVFPERASASMLLVFAPRFLRDGENHAVSQFIGLLLPFFEQPIIGRQRPNKATVKDQQRFVPHCEPVLQHFRNTRQNNTPNYYWTNFVQLRLPLLIWLALRYGGTAQCAGPN